MECDANQRDRKRRAGSRRSRSQPPNDPIDDKASNPRALRLKGFACKYSRKDLQQAAQEVLVALKVPESNVCAIHAGGLASSAIIEFVSEAEADRVYDAAKLSGNITWSEGGGADPHNLKFTHDESREVATIGRGLSVTWDVAGSVLVALAPQGLKFNLITDRPPWPPTGQDWDEGLPSCPCGGIQWDIPLWEQSWPLCFATMDHPTSDPRD